MSAGPRPNPENQHDLELLRTLFETPPEPGREWNRPVALRSAEEQRRHALRPFLLRTWLDHALHHAERVLAAAALLVFVFWLLDGPARDWLHERQRAERAAAAPAPAAATAAPAATSAVMLPAILDGRDPEPAAPTAAPAADVPLPYVTIDMEAAPPPPDEYIAPRRSAPAGPEAPTVPSRLIAPSIGLDTPVYEVFVVDGAWEVADYAAGYMSGTGLPGEGNTALAGHAGIRGAVFKDLGRLAPGDEVLLDAGGWRFRYVVRELKTVWPTQVEILDPTPTPVLTLMTCTNWDTQRLVVVADLIDTLPTPTG